MIDNGSVTLDGAVNAQVAAKTRVGNRIILEVFDGVDNGLDSTPALLQLGHSNPSGALKI